MGVSSRCICHALRLVWVDSRKLVYPALLHLLHATADQRGSARFMLQRAIGGQQVRVDVDCTPVPAEFEDDYDQEEEQQEEDEEVRCCNACSLKRLLALFAAGMLRMGTAP